MKTKLFAAAALASLFMGATAQTVTTSKAKLSAEMEIQLNYGADRLGKRHFDSNKTFILIILKNIHLNKNHL